MASSAIKVLAKLMRVRRESGESPYVLILGAGASLTSGASSFGQVIESVVNDYSRKDPTAMSWDDQVAEFYDILDGLSESERYVIIKEHIEGQRPSAGYHALAQLAKGGYFEVIFSTNYDTFVEDAFADAGLRSRDFTVLINGQDTEEGIIRALSYPQPRIKLVKLHGDLGARNFAFTPEEIFQFSEKVESVLTDYLSRDVMICGHGMRDDDINRCLREKGGSLWYVNPSAPTASDFIWRAMRVRKGTAIEGEDGYFDNFFCALRDELVGASPSEATVSAAAPVAITPAPSINPTPRPDRKGVAEADSEEVKRLTNLLEIHKKNLYHLEEKAAMYGVDAPIYLINQIEHEKGEIQKIEARVQALSSSSPERRGKGFIEASIRESQGKAAAQIFLSYAREDEEKVEKLYQRLSDVGFKPWMDKKDILPGEKWPSSIRRAIRDSDFFLVCLSTNSVKKRGWVQKEMKQALGLWQEKLEDDIYLIPVRLEDCEAPESLREFQWVDLFEEGGSEQLVRAIRVGMERQLSDFERPAGSLEASVQ
jgi:hypothetical protein